MTQRPLPAACRSLAPYPRPRGVVLFIALIVMVALSLAAIALIRSVDTTNAVVGNLSFRMASILPGNLAVEQAAAALFPDADIATVAHIPDKTLDLPAENYFASRQVAPPEDSRGVPYQLQRKSNFTLGRTLVDSSMTGQPTEIRYVIERMCVAPGAATLENCDMLQPKTPPGGTGNELEKPQAPRAPFYRVTIRVDGPQNTASFLQAMLK
jgi:type IV pilus assembly protein PilX